MKTNHTITSLLVAASLALAGPVFAQSTPKPDQLRLDALSKLPDLAVLCELPELRALSRNLMKLGDLGRLEDLDRLGGVDHLGQLAELKGLAASLESMTLDLDRASRDFGRVERGPRQTPRHAGSGGPQQTEKFTKTFRVGRTGSLDLNNIAGDIVIKAAAGDDLVVEAIKRTPQGADAQRQLQAVTITAEEHAGRVEVKTVYPERSNNLHVSVDFTVAVPAGAAVTVHSISGDIQATGTKGSLRLTTVSGDVRADGADQVEELKTVSGDVTVTGGNGSDMRVGSVSGDLTLNNVKARALDAGSISGDMKLNDVTCDRATLHSISGNIEYLGPFAKSGRYQFTAHSGDVRITPSTATGFEVNAETFSGGIRCDVPLTAKTGELSGRHPRRELKGTVGDGSALVTVNTFSGDVTIGKGVK
ncbi:MAG: DUF4097 family beta strand repeat-containing protein [Bacteroidales bacterium]